MVLIEDHPASIELAKYNAQFSKLGNLEIIKGKVEDQLTDVLKEDTASKVALIDPPRAGLSDAARDLLVKTKAIRNLLYLSCNPQSLARDLKGFISHGWQIEKIMPFDFFPKTKHLETLVLLNRK